MASLSVKVIPAAVGRQLVRVSLPLPPGLLEAGRTLVVRDRTGELPAGVRVLTWHPGDNPSTARRALVTWVAEFRDLEPVVLTLEARDPEAAPPSPTRLPVGWEVDGGKLTFFWADGLVVTARLLAPAAAGTGARPAPAVEVVESHGFYRWERLVSGDSRFPRVIEIRADALGQVVLIGHVQRCLPGNDDAPDLGWNLALEQSRGRLVAGNDRLLVAADGRHRFRDGCGCEYHTAEAGYVIYHPAAPYRRKGFVQAREEGEGRTDYRYLRTEATDLTPFQSSSWHRFETVIAPENLARLTPGLACPHSAEPEPEVWSFLYPVVRRPAWPRPELADAAAYHDELILRCAAVGDDWGNLISYRENERRTGNYPMNRLNHCPPIFFAGWQTGNRQLVEAAVRWCENFHDHTIWWGPVHTGGTRYNRERVRQGLPPEEDPAQFCLRSNDSVDFCIKGYDSFYLAYEETGDSRMLRALRAQAAAAGNLVHADRGECRNIGLARDLVRLYRYTAEPHYLDQALRLFRELKTRLWPNGCFDQGGKPETAVLPFIDNDDDGYPHGYAKAYIIGYALAGLPELLELGPDEPRLRQVVQAVADFLAASQDPAGGWRYPHPRSSFLSLGNMEHAWQLVQADRVLGAQPAHLDAIEKALRARILGWRRAGVSVTGVSGWERAKGITRPLTEMYVHPEDRDGSRDYGEGAIITGMVSPEGVVYFSEVLSFYLEHRSAERLLVGEENESLTRILERLPDPSGYQAEGVRDFLPVFRRELSGRLCFPLAWSGRGDFPTWRNEARAKVRECLLAPPPPAAFAPLELGREQRDGYSARKIVFNLTGDSRVPAYLLVPDGEGPFPAVLLLHDHGARFDIGKEKVIQPFGVCSERLDSAREWVGKCYGGRFIGDELARRGFICLAADMLNWGDRGGGGYEGQQALASNLFHLGASWAGLIAHEDLRAAEFLASHNQVDVRRVAALGLSVGGYRTWQLAALSDHIRAGAAICWMATVKGLMVPGNNQARGQSAYSMIHPGIHNYLDYPDLASLACPKPMLFFNGLKDSLFPPSCVVEAYEKMRLVWDGREEGDKLVTKLWDVPHEFNGAMQEEAFGWLSESFRPA